MREALARSLNLATVNLLFRVGIRPVVNLAHQLGIRSHLAPYPSWRSAANAVTLVEMTSAYSVFPAGGRRVEPIFVRRVLDRDGNVLVGESRPGPSDRRVAADLGKREGEHRKCSPTAYRWDPTR